MENVLVGLNTLRSETINVGLKIRMNKLISKQQSVLCTVSNFVDPTTSNKILAGSNFRMKKTFAKIVKQRFSTTLWNVNVKKLFFLFFWVSTFNHFIRQLQLIRSMSNLKRLHIAAAHRSKRQRLQPYFLKYDSFASSDPFDASTHDD